MHPRNDRTAHNDRLFRIKKRIDEKIEDYNNYAFTSIQDCSLKTFFDLAQEFENQYDFYCMSVLIPKVFFDYECVLHLFDPGGELKMTCHSSDIHNIPPVLKWDIPPFYDKPTIKDASFFIPIKGDLTKLYDMYNNMKNGIFGIFEISGASDLSENMKFFFEKYVNRVGFQLHNRIINEKNREHIMFIKNLVNDIGHNVIVPNMFFKLFFKRMKGKIDRIRKIGKELNEKSEDLENLYQGSATNELTRLCSELNYINDSMDEQFQQIITHYEQTSLFLETLLRRSHFEQGHYVLEPKPVNIHNKIIKPQMNRYFPRLKERGIKIVNGVSKTDTKTKVVADVGLISQACANLFSNAVKYTREVSNESGKPEKYISLKTEVLEDYFGKGKPGVKLNMFSTGTPISKRDAKGLFQEGYRGKNSEGEYGTGHGLQFIKEVVEMHNGVVGYKPVPNGNNFYFILPA